MVPVSALTTTSFRSAPTVVPRFNGFTSAQFTGTPKPGHSSGELLHEVDDLIADQFASAGLGVSYSGQSYQERASSGDAALVFALGLVLVFLVLAAQYESWSVPFAVLLGVPFGVLGALLGIWIRHQPNDIYFQVGLITVVGLAAKNAILIVEFANELRAQGMSIREAAVEAARERLRPILMTSFAFILGVLPLMLATRRRRGEPTLDRHRRVRGNVVRDDGRHLLHPALLPDHSRPRRRTSLVGRNAAEADRRADDGARVMRRRLSLLSALVVATGCLAGPRYVPETVASSSQRIGVGRTSDSSRAFFDSLGWCSPSGHAPAWRRFRRRDGSP